MYTVAVYHGGEFCDSTLVVLNFLRSDMKVQFNRLALAEALNLLTSVVPSRTPKPILRCVRLEASAECVHIYATDLEVGLNYILSEVQVIEPGEAVLAADRLCAIVRESLDDVLTLEIEDNTCQIKGSLINKKRMAFDSG